MSKNRKWYTLYDKVYDRNNLLQAWKKVKKNRGKPGYDRESIDKFEAKLERNLEELHRLLREKRYVPPPVWRVNIPKEYDAQGRVIKTRPLGIPTVRDRVVQQAMVQVIGPLFEADFCDSSYGFRPGRNQHQAIAQIREYYKQGYRWW
ncbi:MAG: reverse transcriptase domain-containing protein [Syntrophothermus sp.]